MQRAADFGLHPESTGRKPNGRAAVPRGTGVCLKHETLWSISFLHQNRMATHLKLRAESGLLRPFETSPRSFR